MPLEGEVHEEARAVDERAERQRRAHGDALHLDEPEEDHHDAWVRREVG